MINLFLMNRKILEKKIYYNFIRLVEKNYLIVKILELSPFKADFCVVDVETTGMSPKSDRIIEIGLVKIKDLKIEETFQAFINPGIKIPPFITKLTGINDTDVNDAPFFEDIIFKLNSFIGESILVSHNIPFDSSFLRYEYKRARENFINNSTLCTLKLARKIYPTLPSKSLSAVIKHLNIKHKNVHRALGDSLVTAQALIKMIEELELKFDIITLNDLLAFQDIPILEMKKKVEKKVLSLNEEIPKSAGVYFFKDKQENIIYIGKSKSLNKRIKNYFSDSTIKKSKKIASKSSSLEFQRTNSELSALIMESSLIKEYKPKFNSLLKKFGNTYFIKVTKSESIPKIIITDNFENDGDDYFGPYSKRDSAKTLIEIINKTFRLRECSDKELSKQRVCFLYHIERCTGPCEHSDLLIYNEELSRLYEFLGGKNQFAIERLLKKMKGLSEKKKFEEAAQYRDTINLVLSQITKSALLSGPVNKANILLEILENGIKDFLLIIKGKVFLKNGNTDDQIKFEKAAEEYFRELMFSDNFPDELDLDKLKIIFSWINKNRNKVKVHYLNEFENYIKCRELFLVK